MSTQYQRLSFPCNASYQICCKLLYQECYIELEKVLYLNPHLTACFDFLFPTIVVVDSDQYDKYQKFIHTRERPFGSKDLFIIKQDSAAKTDRRAQLKSKCYIVLGSETAQQHVPPAFKTFGRFVSLVENENLFEFNINDSCKCFELVFKAEIFDEYEFRSSGYTHSSQPFGHSFHLAMLLKVFLNGIRPHMWRFESYTGCDNLRSDYSETYNLYCNLNSINFPISNSHRQVHEDSVLYTPKCSFEFIKDIDEITSLYQYKFKNSGKYKIKGLEESKLEQETSSFSRKLWQSIFKPSIELTLDLFHNVRDVKFEKVFSKELKSSFVSIDCSRAAYKNTTAFAFVYTSYNLFHSYISRNQFYPSTRAHRTPEEIFLENSCRNVKLNYYNISSLPFYIHLSYKDFLNEKLQSVDITIFNPNLERKEEKLYKGQPKIDGLKNSKDLSLKDLESEINSSLRLIANARCNINGSYLAWQNIESLCQNIKEDLVNVFLNRSNSIKGLNQEQPFRLRVFNKYSYSLDMDQTIGEINNWFKANMY